MIKGIGNDLMEIDRIRKVIQRWGPRFIQRVFTLRESLYCSNYADQGMRYAGRFSAKESVAKALGTGFGKEIGWLDIEIVNNLCGKPEVSFSEKVIEKFKAPTISLSITHTHRYVSTIAIWVAT